MCFSATASFALSSVLLPMGGWCIQKAWRGDRRFLALATFPLAFGTQQAIEGLVWLGINHQNPALTHQAALGFVGFSHGFWLFWTPFMVSLLEGHPQLRWLWRAIALMGLALGAYLLIPVVIHPDWLTVSIHNHSLDYGLQILIDHPAMAYLGRILYVSIILVPLLLTQIIQIQRMGALVLVSLLLTSALFHYGFISVWCFFAAVASAYIGFLFAQGIETVPELSIVSES